MNNMGFFNPFGGSGSGGGGGGGSTANYSVKTFTDSSGQVSYKLTKNGTAVGDVISFNGSNMLVSYGGELVVLNSAIAGIEEVLDKTYNFTTFTELGINTQNKTLSQLSTELAAKNLEEGTVVTGRVYSEALPYDNYGNAEVLVNNSIFWWKTSSSTISPYSWNAIVVGNTIKMDWTPTYYQLPIASVQSLGGVKIGDNVQIAPDGTISVITTKGDTGTGIASIAKTSSSGLNDIYTITYTDSTTSTFTITNGATITGGSIGQTGHLILTMSDGRTIDAGALPTDNEVEVTTTSSQPADPNVELWVDLSTQQTLSIPEINDSSTSSTQDTWSCKKIHDDQQRQEEEIGVVANAGAKNLFDINAIPVVYHITYTLTGGVLSGTSNGDWASYNVPMNLPAGNYIFSAVISNFSRASDAGEGTIRIRITDSVSGGTTIGTTNITGNGAISIPFSWSGGQFYVQYNFNFSSTGSYVNSFTASNNMLRPAAITDPTYQPYALPNPVITPAAIKAVDEGAKNIVHTQDIIRQGRGYTATPNGDGTYTVTGSRTEAGSAWFEVADVSAEAGSYMLSGGVIGIPVAISAGGSVVYAGNTAQQINAEISNKLYIHIMANFNQSNINYVIKPMICTAADWAVSQKFVPYALTNLELTSKLMTDEADITSLKHMVNPRSQSQVSGGNLDNITVSEIRVYIAPSGLPTGVSASSICIVETLVVDSNSAYQVITLLSNQGTAQDRSYPTYKRVKVGGVWYDWKLIIS